MKGLFRNNFSAVWTNAKIFSVLILVWGILVVAVPSQTLQMFFILTGTVGFSIIAVAGIGSESGSKWGKYKLTLPIKRSDVVKSLFLNQIFWVSVGTLLTGIAILLSCLLHGCPSDQIVVFLSLFAMGISIGLLMGAMFTPLFYLGGEEKSIVLLIITLLCTFGIDSLIFNITSNSPVFGIVVLLICSAAFFALSYPLALYIYKRKEY